MIIFYTVLTLLIVISSVVILVIWIVKMNRVMESLRLKLSEVEKIFPVYESRIGSLVAIVGGQIGLADTVGPLVSCLKDENKQIQQVAAETLVCLGHLAIEPLVLAVKDRSVPLSIVSDVLKRLDTYIDFQNFLTLPDELQCQLMSVIEKKSLENDDLLQLSRSNSPEVLSFVLSHEKICEVVLHKIAEKGHLPSVLQEKIAYHHLADESSLRQLIPHAEDRLLEKLSKDPNVAHNVQKAANNKLSERQHKREEEAQQKEIERERERDRREYDYECWGIR